VSDRKPLEVDPVRSSAVRALVVKAARALAFCDHAMTLKGSDCPSCGARYRLLPGQAPTWLLPVNLRSLRTLFETAEAFEKQEGGMS
jgi:hypothetical protein